jgi:hypothetical protein
MYSSIILLTSVICADIPVRVWTGHLATVCAIIELTEVTVLVNQSNDFSCTLIVKSRGYMC